MICVLRNSPLFLTCYAFFWNIKNWEKNCLKQTSWTWWVKIKREKLKVSSVLCILKKYIEPIIPGTGFLKRHPWSSIRHQICFASTCWSPSYLWTSTRSTPGQSTFPPWRSTEEVCHEHGSFGDNAQCDSFKKLEEHCTRRTAGVPSEN
jgi:hypothetical protein